MMVILQSVSYTHLDVYKRQGYDLGVGSGFTDKQRDYYWNNPDEIIGKIVQIKFKAETKNKDGGISVQFPIFEIVRTDKTEPSYN